MESRLFHAVVAAGLSLGAASVGLAACSDPSPEGPRAEGLAHEAGVDGGAATDATAITDSSFGLRDGNPDAVAYPEKDAAIDGDAGWPTTK